MFGIKSRKRIKELEARLLQVKKDFAEKWELKEKIPGLPMIVYKDLPRQLLLESIARWVSEAKKTSLKLKKLTENLKEKEQIIVVLESEIETLKSKLSRKKK